VSRREWALLLAILFAGVFLRVSFPTRMAVEHFDEGVYASNIWFGPEYGFQYPGRHLYAPPLLPTLIEFAIVAERVMLRSTGPPSSLAVMCPSLLAGCVTVLLVWWIGRQWLGVGGGLAAAVLAATSDFHMLYSRAALTDALLVLFVLLAVWLTERGCRLGSARVIVLAGLATACAWWAKYNGWLPVAIAAAGWVIAGALRRASLRQVVVRLCWVSAVAAVALLVWSPYLYWLQPLGGYAQVAANHQRYVAGLSGWPDGLCRQWANLRFFDGPVSGLGVLLALVIGSLTRAQRMEAAAPQGAKRDVLVLAAFASLVTAVAMWLGTAATLVTLAVAGLGSSIRCKDIASPSERTNDRPEALSLLAAWLAGLLVATPLYYPYPRLTLPWLCGAWLGAGWGISQLVVVLTKQPPRNATPWRARMLKPSVAWACLAVGCALIAWRLPALTEKGVPAWQARDGVRQAAARIASDVRQLAANEGRPWQETVVFVYGEPALLYHLQALGMPMVFPTGSARPPTDAPFPVLLATGLHAHRSPEFQQQWAREQSGYRLVRRHVYRPSDLVLLDQNDPRALAEMDGGPCEELRWYEPR
jgi:hypothetical protein